MACSSRSALPPGATTDIVTRLKVPWVGPFGSYHAGNVLMAAFGDGAVSAISDEIDSELFRRLGNRSDGELTPPASRW